MAGSIREKTQLPTNDARHHFSGGTLCGRRQHSLIAAINNGIDTGIRVILLTAEDRYLGENSNEKSYYNNNSGLF